jgi:hypothetical protein
VPVKDSDAIASPGCHFEHGKLRLKQGYSSAMLIHESTNPSSDHLSGPCMSI